MNSLFQRMFSVVFIAVLCASFGSAKLLYTVPDGEGGGSGGGTPGLQGCAAYYSGWTYPNAAPAPRSGLTGDCAARTSCLGGEIPVFKIEFATGAGRIESLSGTHLSTSYKVCCPVSSSVVACESTNWPTVHLCGGYNIDYLDWNTYGVGDASTWGYRFSNPNTNFKKGETLVFSSFANEFYHHEGLPFMFGSYGASCSPDYACLVKFIGNSFASCGTASASATTICMQKASGTVTGPPVASFTATPLSGAAPLTVQFTSQSSNSPACLEWGFSGGGFSSNDLQNANPIHTYIPNSWDPPTVVYAPTLRAFNAAGASAVFTGSSITVGAPIPDTTRPATIVLSAPSSTSSSVTLSWIAPGDDGSGGGSVAGYDVRYSSSGIIDTDAKFAVAPSFPGPVPVAPGGAQTVTVTGLSASTTYWFAVKARDEVPNWGFLSNSPSKATGAGADTTRPATIVLSAPSSTSSSVTLSWIAPGDDGSGGGSVAGYDVRYSSSGIIDTDVKFTAASSFAGPVPVAPGGAQTVTVTGLSASTTYWFAVKAYDEVPNYGLLSNSPSIATTAVSCQDVDITTSYSYSPRNWVSGISIANVQTIESGANVFNTFQETYKYDNVGNLDYLKEFENLTGSTNRVFKRTSFTYDNLNRLTGATGVNGQTGDPNPSSPLQKAGRYFDTLAWTYDKVGNIKSNYELEYCYKQGGSDVCGSSITNVDNNRLTKVKAFGANGIDTSYSYDAYGNLQSESSWQEIPVGDVDYLAAQPNKLFILFADGSVPSGTSIKVMYYHRANGIFGLNQLEQYAWTTTTANSGYSGTKSPYWDGSAYTLNALIDSAKVLAGTTGPAADFYDNLFYPNPTVPHIKQYFRAYKSVTTTYCWDVANRMTKWFDGTNCQVYSYDHAGNRIKKVTTEGAQTLYITQGNNVIYEEESTVAGFSCPTSCA